ncbi:MAG: asparagine synthase (glutamine-hydrolyzing) [Candidatus Wallbacteria bacterium]|nr:asparagine synthase (glutamine-hydrolyzing) [Candidatus Wallbacteria bacterium]
MCGITGYVGLHDPSLLGEMTKAVAHRGPDSSGCWHDASDRVGLGHRRLSIIDLRPEGDQPMCNEDGSVWVTFNGEIYNFQELRAELVARGHAFKSRTDTEVLVHLYEDLGEGMLERLDGIFAFGLWDRRTQRLLLARDPLGVKPLYYAETSEGFFFASELKALLCARSVSRDVDFDAIRSYMTFLWAPGSATMLKSVRKLEPGEAMWVEGGRIVRRWAYYDIPYTGELEDCTEREAADRLEQLLERAVRRQMMSDVEVGAFLSGGLDSSTVVALMRRLNPGSRIRAYTMVNSESDGDEGFVPDIDYARRVAKQFSIELREIRVQVDVLDLLDEMVYLLDEPLADPAPLNLLLICRQAHEDGIKVLMSGTGGDDILAGYRRHLSIVLERWWGWLPGPALRGLAAFSQLLPTKPAWARRFRRVFEHAHLPPQERLLTYLTWAEDRLLQGLFAKDVNPGASEFDPLRQLRKTLARIPRETNPLNQMLYLDTKHFLPDHNLNYTDKMSMASGVEVRVPLLDLDLVRFATRLPPGMKMKGLTGKHLLRESMRATLPNDVLTRPKSGFGAPLRKWILEDLTPKIEELLGKESISRRGWFDPAAVAALVDANRRQLVDASYPIFSLMCIETWARQFLDARRVPPSS